MLALFLQSQAIPSIDSFVTVVLTTAEGATFLLVGSLVGALLATLLFSLTVIVIFPLLGHASWHLYERLVSEA